ncbi:MAG: hypothetical protein ACXVJK_04800 [Candidatus Aminicenantales bacterium]
MSRDLRLKNRLMSGLCLLFLAALTAGRSAEQASLRAGQETQGPWWMRQTMLTPEGKFASLKTRRWWKKAMTLKPGQSMILDVSGEAKDKMLVRREMIPLHGGPPVDTIIWVIDDDGDGSVQKGGDRDSDCYVIDYGADGIVDRMVDYIDDNNDGRADEMDVRFFKDGVLSYAWFGVDIDRDGALWNIKAFDDSLEECRTCDPNGDNLFYVNAFNPERGTWVPLGECPIAFYDTDGDGFSEIAVRVSVVPAAWDPAKDPDFASRAYAGPWDKGMADAVVANIRSSYDIDQESSREAPFHYEMSFNLVGRTPFKFPDVAHSNPLRRPPQETIALPWKDVRALADTYEATETGFSWVENTDEATVPLSAEGTPDDPNRKGLAWPWERRFMENSGGPSRKWNVRREWSSKPSAKRELYYSEIDKRIHLYGAEEGWIEVGNFGGLGAVAEIRMFDTDGNGFFDRWEVYLSNSTRPVRVTQVTDEKARRVDAGPGALAEFYAKEVLPRAKAENAKILDALTAVHAYDPPAELKSAINQGPEGYRRYAQDVLRELTYLGFRDYYSTLANQTLLKNSWDHREGEFWGELPGRGKPRKAGAEPAPESVKAWKLARLLEDLDISYGRADYGRAAGLISDIRKLAGGQ